MWLVWHGYYPQAAFTRTPDACGSLMVGEKNSDCTVYIEHTYMVPLILCACVVCGYHARVIMLGDVEYLVDDSNMSVSRLFKAWATFG